MLTNAWRVHRYQRVHWVPMVVRSIILVGHLLLLVLTESRIRIHLTRQILVSREVRCFFMWHCLRLGLAYVSVLRRILIDLSSFLSYQLCCFKAPFILVLEHVDFEIVMALQEA